MNREALEYFSNTRSQEYREAENIKHATQLAYTFQVDITQSSASIRHSLKGQSIPGGFSHCVAPDFSFQ